MTICIVGVDLDSRNNIPFLCELADDSMIDKPIRSPTSSTTSSPTATVRRPPFALVSARARKMTVGRAAIVEVRGVKARMRPLNLSPWSGAGDVVQAHKALLSSSTPSSISRQPKNGFCHAHRAPKAPPTRLLRSSRCAGRQRAATSWRATNAKGGGTDGRAVAELVLPPSTVFLSSVNALTPAQDIQSSDPRPSEVA